MQTRTATVKLSAAFSVVLEALVLEEQWSSQPWPDVSIKKLDSGVVELSGPSTRVDRVLRHFDDNGMNVIRSFKLDPSKYHLGVTNPFAHLMN